MGFLFAAGLFGLFALLVPIYLHFMRRRRQVQEVPSLRLFQVTARRTRKLNFQQLLLLLTRLLVLGSIVLLLSQPFWQTSLQLPLPRVPGDDPERPTIGIVLDDSLLAVAGVGEDNRLQRARAWLRAVIAGLPAEAEVYVVPSSAPYPSDAMSTAEAAEFIQRVAAVPRQGDAAAALSALAENLLEARGCLIVAAPRQASLWQHLDPESDFAKTTELLFFDTTQWDTAVIVRDVSPARDQPGFVCRLDGEPELLRGRELLVRADERLVRTVEVSPHAALQGRVLFQVPADDAAPAYELALGAEAPHPWQRAWFTAAARVDPGEPLGVIVRRPDDAGLLADRILTAVFRATRPRVRLEHRDPDSREPLPEGAALILVGDVTVPGLASWIEGQSRPRVLVAPPPGGGPVGFGLIAGWGPPQRRSAAQLAPLRIGEQTAIWPEGLEDLLLAATRQEWTEQGIGLTPPVLRQPEMPTGQAIPVLSGADGERLITAAALPNGGALWAIGWPLDLAEGSVMANPFVPLILAQMLFPASASASAIEGQVVAGQTVDLPLWFGLDRVNGRLHYPDGSALTVRAPPGAGLQVTVTEPGIYRYEGDSDTRYRAANFPRPEVDSPFTRAQWAAARPNTPTRWLGPEDRVTAADFGRVGAPADRGREVRYDLSGVVVALVLLYLFLEAAALVAVWRHRYA